MIGVALESISEIKSMGIYAQAGNFPVNVPG